MNDTASQDREDVVILYLAKYLNENECLRTTAVCCCVVLMVLCIATHAILLLYLRWEKKRAALSTNQVVILAMTISALVFSPMGLTSSLVLSLQRTHSRFAEHLETVSLWTVFFCFATNLHLVMLMHVTRYRTIVADPLVRVTHKAVYIGVALVICYTLLTSTLALLPKVLMSVELISRKSSLRRIATITAVSVWLTVSLTVMLGVTYLIICQIRKQQREVQCVLQNQYRVIDTKRLKIIFVQGLVYMIIWLPFGVVVGRKSSIPLRSYVLAVFFFTIFMHTSILVLPIMNYFMDKHFEDFLNEYTTCPVWRKRVDSMESNETASASSPTSVRFSASRRLFRSNAIMPLTS